MKTKSKITSFDNVSVMASFSKDDLPALLTFFHNTLK